MGFFSKKQKLSVDEMKKEIIRLIDENKENIYKVAFYSQSEVQRILNNLIEKWTNANYQGGPIDYATPEEIQILYRLAKKITSMRPEELWASYGELFMPK
ncbi:MAG: hypothetical protein QXH78_03695 [Desulfurococcaceae archaeon]